MAIEFKCEASLWEYMANGTKTWDARLWDMADDRIYALAWGARAADGEWMPDVEEVGFRNKDSGALLVFEYQGVEFLPWAAGWGFLRLGGLISRVDPAPLAS